MSAEAGMANANAVRNTTTLMRMRIAPHLPIPACDHMPAPTPVARPAGRGPADGNAADGRVGYIPPGVS